MNEKFLTMFTESIISTVPSMAAILVGIFALKNILNKYLSQKDDYKQDKYRLDMERRLFLLNESMLKSQERFSRVNHLVIEGNATHTSGLLNSMGVDKNIKVKLKTAFVLTPFHPEFDESYGWIVDFFKDHQYSCTRGDAILADTNILSHILSEMLAAEIVVANISGRNPNVFYELGIAHALGKKVVIISRSKDDITFDLASTQIAIYKDKDSLIESLNKWLISILHERANTQTPIQTKTTSSINYSSPAMRGVVSFDYSDNNGIFKIGEGAYEFETCWSKASDTSIHILNDPSSIETVAIAKNEDITSINDASIYNSTSRSRTPKTNQIVILKNTHGYFAALKILNIKDDTRDSEFDEVTFEYIIKDDKSSDFSN
jgi:nucleoside 2-deoxyribosyltransferase